MKKKSNFVEKNKKQIVIAAIAIVLLLGGAYAWLQITLHGTKRVRIEAGTLELQLNEGDSIHVEEAVPITDEDGLKTAAYTFTLKNTGNITSEYTIYLDDDANTEGITEDDQRFDDSVLKYNLEKNENSAVTGLLSSIKNANNERVLDKGTIEVGEANKKTYSLRLWIKEDAVLTDIQHETSTGAKIGNVFAGKIRVEASQIRE